MIFNKALSAAEVQGFAALAVKADELGSEGGNKEEDKTTPGQDPSGGGTGDKNEPPAAKVKASSVSVKAAGYTLTENKLTLKKGRSVKLVAAVSPKKASQKVTYSSSRKKVASFSRTGVVKAKKAGTAKITVKTVNGRKRVITVKVVKKDKVNRRLILSKKKLSLKKGRTAQIKIKKMTAGTTSRLTYRSGKKGVVSVDKRSGQGKEKRNSGYHRQLWKEKGESKGYGKIKKEYPKQYGYKAAWRRYPEPGREPESQAPIPVYFLSGREAIPPKNILYVILKSAIIRE